MVATKRVCSLIELKAWDTFDVSSTLGINVDHAFVGKSGTEERVRCSRALLKKKTKKITEVSYNPSSSLLCIDEEDFNFNRILKFKADPNKTYLIDSTSLDVPSTIYLMKMLSHSHCEFYVMYGQPSKYKRQSDLKSEIEFQLSNDLIDTKFLPGFFANTEDSKVVVGLGFEGRRLGSLLSSDQFDNANFTGLFGIPAFKTGWENISLNAHSELLTRYRSRINCEIAAANDPFSVYLKIKKIHSSISASTGNSAIANFMLLAPYGTKPTTIGMAWFALNAQLSNKDIGVGIIYDFVEMKNNWSTGIDLVHLWRFTCN